MSWTYEQRTGRLSHPDGSVFQCYSGFGEGKNNPEMQHVHDIGPIPVGLYRMTEVIEYHPKLGNYVVVLDPFPDNEMFGRGDFRLHGDSISAPGTASHGCIIKSPEAIRRKIRAHEDDVIEVVSGEPEQDARLVS